jgi:hypothetical protein
VRRLALFLAVLWLIACGPGLEGTYRDAMGVTQYRFKKNGKVYFSVMGVETELDYSVDGDRVKIGKPEGNLVLTLEEDGSLRGPMGFRLTKDSGSQPN